VSALTDKDPAAARAFNVAALERQRTEAAQRASEERYRALERSIMAELGVKEEDVTPLAAAAGLGVRTMTPAESEAAHMYAGAGAGGARPAQPMTDGFGASEGKVGGAGTVVSRADVVPPTGGPAAAMLTKKALSGSGAAAARTLAAASKGPAAGGAGPAGAGTISGLPAKGFRAVAPAAGGASESKRAGR
jgi:hypothetical protein